MFNDNAKKRKHGGTIARGGRKTKYDKTKVMRIQVAYEDAIKGSIKHLDTTSELNGFFDAVKSDPIFIRSLQDKKTIYHL
ncbi:hypothetical protein L2734_03690 [Parashewanella spongiae]|uniref:hypothetical protein n=1 Tax=Parashewanella spongiae TaxID=342950 RepID=UPI0014052E16|nr:hypothetical protein [Parashewanella spongiae]MCL1077288.1 hypothetical protein [Parashewanella spongiae]